MLQVVFPFARYLLLIIKYMLQQSIHVHSAIYQSYPEHTRLNSPNSSGTGYSSPLGLGGGGTPRLKPLKDHPCRDNNNNNKTGELPRQRSDKGLGHLVGCATKFLSQTVHAAPFFHFLLLLIFASSASSSFISPSFRLSCAFVFHLHLLFAPYTRACPSSL